MEMEEQPVMLFNYNIREKKQENSITERCTTENGLSSMTTDTVYVDADAEASNYPDNNDVPSAKRKRGEAWTEEEHQLFLVGLEKFGKGNWSRIAKHFVKSRTPTQVASHAQKYFLRKQSTNSHHCNNKRRTSIFDTPFKPLNSLDIPKIPSESTKSIISTRNKSPKISIQTTVQAEDESRAIVPLKPAFHGHAAPNYRGIQQMGYLEAKMKESPSHAPLPIYYYRSHNFPIEPNVVAYAPIHAYPSGIPLRPLILHGMLIQAPGTPSGFQNRRA